MVPLKSCPSGMFLSRIRARENIGSDEIQFIQMINHVFIPPRHSRGLLFTNKRMLIDPWVLSASLSRYAPWIPVQGHIYIYNSIGYRHRYHRPASKFLSRHKIGRVEGFMLTLWMYLSLHRPSNASVLNLKEKVIVSRLRTCLTVVSESRSIRSIHDMYATFKYANHQNHTISLYDSTRIQPFEAYEQMHGVLTLLVNLELETNKVCLHLASRFFSMSAATMVISSWHLPRSIC